jgi:hypothetical protein
VQRHAIEGISAQPLSGLSLEQRELEDTATDLVGQGGSMADGGESRVPLLNFKALKV